MNLTLKKPRCSNEKNSDSTFFKESVFQQNTVVVKTRVADVGVLPVSDPAFDNKKPGS